MKKLALLLLVFTIELQGQITISSYSVIPQPIVTTTPLKIVTEIATNYLAIKLASSFSVNMNQKSIDLETCYCLTPLPTPESYLDTFSVGNLSAGTYTVYFKAKLSSSNTVCIESTYDAETFTLQVDLPNFLSENTNDLNIAIFPNPVKDKLKFESSNQLLGDLKLSISDAIGQVVYSENKLDLKEDLDLSFLQAGVFFLKIESDKDLKVFKIVKE